MRCTAFPCNARVLPCPSHTICTHAIVYHYVYKTDTSAHNATSSRLFHLDLSAIPKSPSTGALDFSMFDFFGAPEKLPVTKLVDDFEAAYDYVS